MVVANREDDMPEISDAAEVRRAHRSELDPISFLWRSQFVYPEKVAVVHEERRYTYRQPAERVRRLASALQDAGLAKGDRVAVIARTSPRCSRRTTACRPRVGCSSRSTTG